MPENLLSGGAGLLTAFAGPTDGASSRGAHFPGRWCAAGSRRTTMAMSEPSARWISMASLAEKEIASHRDASEIPRREV